MSLGPRWTDRTRQVEIWLEQWLFSYGSGIKVLPSLREMMRYSLLAPCKRFRPVLYLTTLEALGMARHQGRHGALALECIHTYSLIHDDLPCMDDDDLRRGRASSHRRFGEAHAVLAGDGLLTLAFQLLSMDPPSRVGPMVRELAEASGLDGMVAGQILDMEGHVEGGDIEQLLAIHRRKTGALISCCMSLAGQRAGCGPSDLKLLRGFGASLGLVFQIQDDILDCVAEEGELGKTSGKDEEQGKLTYPSLLGLDGAKERLKMEVDRAEELMNASPLDPAEMKPLLHFLATRSH